MKKIIFTLTVLLMTMTAVSAQAILGDWKGSIEPAPGMKLELIFHISQTDNALSATLDVPMQGVAGLAVDKVSFEDNTLKMSINMIQLKYEGKLDGNKITGEMEQGGAKLPLILEKFENKLPGDTSLPSSEEDFKALAALVKGDYKYKVEDYFARPKASSFKISPDGKYLSYMEKDADNKRHVYVKNIKTGEVKRAIEEKDELIKGYSWVNKGRLVYMMDQGGNENYHIYAVNIDGTNNIDLTPFEDVNASILHGLKEQEDYIIISMNKNNKQIFDPYKLNIVTGEMKQLFENSDPSNPIQDFEFDKNGELRAYSKLQDGVKANLYYKDLATGKFNLIKSSNWDDVFSISMFNYPSKNPDEAYVLTNLDSDKTRIVLYDFKKNQLVKEVFANPDYDVDGFSTSRKRNYEIDYFYYEGEKMEYVPVSGFYKDMRARMQKGFPGMDANIVGYDDDEKTMLIIVHSEKRVGTYYSYDAESKKFTLIYDLMPQLKAEDMAEMKPISFKSRDGLTIHGYITLPKAALEGKKVPLIVNPHGGPQGIRDSWGFNPEAQLFASRGYATLQVNFRISGGYGKEFLRAGFKQIGRKAMDDVEDGVRYAIAQGWVDPDRIAIYGASHGGYATLMGMIKTPELYACGVDYVGVSNIFTFFDSFPEYWKPMKEIVKQIWYDLDNPEEAKIAKEVSPVFQIDKLKKPLFVVQGANDPRVNINESDQIVKALRQRGFDVPYMVKYNEGHGFSREENTMELYRAMLGFFAKHLK